MQEPVTLMVGTNSQSHRKSAAVGKSLTKIRNTKKSVSRASILEYLARLRDTNEETALRRDVS